jgi:hypothetical protein
MIAIKNFRIVALLSIIVLLGSCGQNHNRSKLPRSIGNTSEVLVVVQDEAQWDGTIGKTLRKYLEADQYGLPQQESLFKLAHINKSSFSELFQKHHSLIFIDINVKYKKTRLTRTKNKWAKPQIIYTISAPSNMAVDTTFARFADEIIKGLGKVERARIMNVFNAAADIDVMQKFADKFSLKMTIPDGFYVAKNKPGFMWLKRDANKYNQGILAISVPYKDTLQFTNPSIAARIMLFMKNYIPGPTDGSYMTLDTTYVPPVSKPVTDYFVPFTIETRGMWRVEHDFMAGPYVAYTFISPATGELVTLFGYVYKPNKDKRNLLRQMEAVLYSTQEYKKE